MMNSTEAHELGVALTAYLDEHRLSNAEFARRFGLSEGTVASVKEGRGGQRRTVEVVRRAIGGPPVVESLAAAQTLPAEVLLAREVVSMWLLGIPDEQRGRAAERLLALIREAQSD